MTFGLIFIEPFMRLLGSTDTILPYAMEYARYILIAAPAMTGSCVLNNILRYEGKAKLAMIGLTSGGIFKSSSASGNVITANGILPLPQTSLSALTSNGLVKLEQFKFDATEPDENGYYTAINVYKDTVITTVLKREYHTFKASAPGNIVIAGKGWGHNLGMSQYGARDLAVFGAEYDQIIHAYYANVNITSLK